MENFIEELITNTEKRKEICEIIITQKEGRTQSLMQLKRIESARKNQPTIFMDLFDKGIVSLDVFSDKRSKYCELLKNVLDNNREEKID